MNINDLLLTLNLIVFIVDVTHKIVMDLYKVNHKKKNRHSSSK